MNKSYREYIGRLARYDQSGRNSISINRMNIIQYNVKALLLPDAVTSFVTGFGNLLSDFSDDIYAGDDARIDNFKAFIENQFFIFKVQTKNVNGMEVRSMTDVYLVPMLKSFDQSTESYAVPVFCSKSDKEAHDWEYSENWNLYRNHDTRAEFPVDIKVGEQFGSLYGYDIGSPVPAFVLWRDVDGKFFVIGSIESAETDPVGACVLQGKYLFMIDMSEHIEDLVYDDSYNPCVSYVSADVYRKIDNQLKSAVLQTEEDEEEARQKAAAECAAAGAALRETETAGRREESVAEETEDTASQSAVGQELKEQLDKTELEKIATTKKNGVLIFDMMEYYAQKSRCYYKRSDFVNFHTAVKYSDLVVLSGFSGAGKSSLVNVYAKALGLNASADLEDSQMLMVPVRLSWSDDADLLGYVDFAHMVYHAADSGFVDSLARAQRGEDKNKPFLICFEKMNLAWVEHHFSQFLSILERPAGQRELQFYDKQYMGKLYNAADYPFQIEIDNNVKFIGTVNIDETTHYSSDKVPDRANVVELEVLNYVTGWQDKTFAVVGKTQIWSIQDYEKLIVKEQIPNAREVRSLLQEVYCALQNLSPKYGVGSHVVKNVLKYLSNLPREEALDFDRAFDLQLAQRVLTKLRGVESVVGPVLQENGEGSLLMVLNKHQSLPRFVKSRALLVQRGKEVESCGYCN